MVEGRPAALATSDPSDAAREPAMPAFEMTDHSDAAITRDEAEFVAVRDRLIQLAHRLGREERAQAILGEGNVSAALSDGSFLVKASGSSLPNLRADDLTRVDRSIVLQGLATLGSRPSDAEVEALLADARVDRTARMPSVETFLHALCLEEAGVDVVGHTHAEAIIAVLCSQAGAEPFLHHLFPDAIVVCGHQPAVIPYVDPGHALALAVKDALDRYRSDHGHPPKLLLMENHGPVALGANTTEVANVLFMAAKWARVLIGTYAFGGPRFLGEEVVRRIDGRLDEARRRRALLEDRS